jgi:hypothetical protein
MSFNITSVAPWRFHPKAFVVNISVPVFDPFSSVPHITSSGCQRLNVMWWHRPFMNDNSRLPARIHEKEYYNEWTDKKNLFHVGAF